MELPSEFLHFSAELGANFHLIQGAGGNTSIKLGDLLWVKSSGTRLQEAETKNIFTQISLHVDAFAPIEQHPGTLKPSIETNLHLLMPHKVVAHVHAIDVIAIAVLLDAEKRLREVLNDLSWSFVSYHRPGLPLVNAIGKTIAKNIGTPPDILVLGNHGLVVGAESVEKVRFLIEAVSKRLKKITRPPKKLDSFGFPSKNIPGFVPANLAVAHIAATDAPSIAFAKSGSLYPDHVVFLKRGAMAVESGSSIANDRETDLVLIKGEGAYVPENATQSAHEMAGALGLVTSRIPIDGTVRYLTREEEDELLDWDAEKFRQSLDNHSSLK